MRNVTTSRKVIGMLPFLLLSFSTPVYAVEVDWDVTGIEIIEETETETETDNITEFIQGLQNIDLDKSKERLNEIDLEPKYINNEAFSTREKIVTTIKEILVWIISQIREQILPFSILVALFALLKYLQKKKPRGDNNGTSS